MTIRQIERECGFVFNKRDRLYLEKTYSEPKTVPSRCKWFCKDDLTIVVRNDELYEIIYDIFAKYYTTRIIKFWREK